LFKDPFAMSTNNDKLVVRLSDCQAERIAWLWPGYIPAAKLTLIDGDPSQGKSLMTLDLAARLSSGRPMPDGHAVGGAAPVVLVGSEDGLRDTVMPRLQAAGADLRGVHAFAGRKQAAGTYRRPVLPDDTHLLQETIQENNARLVIVDPLMAFLSVRACSLNDQMIRQALAPLAQVAEDTGAAVLLVRHLTKGGGQQALYRGLGSIGIIATVRSGLLVGRSPYDAAHRVLASTKSNLTEPPASQGFDIRAGEHGQPVLHWTGAVDLYADDLIVFGAREHGAMLRRARSFLEEVLRNGPCSFLEIEQKARAAGLAEKTLRRAKTELGVRSEQRGAEGGCRSWYWSLADKPQPADDSESWGERRKRELEEAQKESDAIMARLRARYGNNSGSQ
jgi:AAA domain